MRTLTSAVHKCTHGETRQRGTSLGIWYNAFFSEFSEAALSCWISYRQLHAINKNISYIGVWFEAFPVELNMVVSVTKPAACRYIICSQISKCHHSYSSGKAWWQCHNNKWNIFGLRRKCHFCMLWLVKGYLSNFPLAYADYSSW